LGHGAEDQVAPEARRMLWLNYREPPPSTATEHEHPGHLVGRTVGKATVDFSATMPAFSRLPSIERSAKVAILQWRS